MLVQCYELMKIPSFKNIHLVSGEAGLGRQVTWVYVLTTPFLEDWVHGGEIMFVVNHQNVLQIVEEAATKHLSAVVVLKNEQNESLLNEEIINLSNKEQLPLFEMDYRTKILDITKDISTYIIHKQEKVDYINHFFYNILFSENPSQKGFEEYMIHIGIHEDDNCFITTLYSEDPSKLEQIEVSLQLNLGDPHIHFLTMIFSPYIITLTFAVPSSIKKAKKLMKSVFSMLSEKYPDMLYMGIGNTCTSLSDVHCSYLKSVKSIPLCTKEKRIIDYEELGFPRLLLNALDFDEIKEYADSFLKEIKEYDERNRTFFLQTIEAYILNNGNISKTSTQLYIHRNTCVYRLDKIKELFRIDLDDPNTRIDMLNSLNIYRFLDRRISVR
ncbi:PucR family transcriptional regulator [Niallia sp. Krafla_26]|uniref:PucR family transcriptional regulator n=1 Tax=Niallia sp. Krafla_26 TaxID=3064703 RepID=UPI003D17C413